MIRASLSARPAPCAARAPDRVGATCARGSIQPKLRIGAANDPLEHEADRAADAVMRGETVGALASAPPAARRACAGCEAEADEEAPVQRKCAACEAAGAGHEAGGEAAGAAVTTGGAPLSPELRAYFEPRFGQDFGGVRVHTHARAADAANAIGARAYTLGPDLAFAAGQFAPAEREGRRLIAHELAHVVQQAPGSGGTIRRAVGATSNCPASIHGASATPLDDLRVIDEEARRMALGASNVLTFEALTFRSPTFGPSYVSRAYERRFGGAGPATGRGSAGRFRNRFNGRTFPSQPEAAAAEMQSLAARFRTLHTYLGTNIRYRCPGTAPFNIGGCTGLRCRPGNAAWTCTPTDGRSIAICPDFWGMSAAQRAAMIVHESVHMRLDFSAENSATLGQRGTNAECYASLILDLYGEGVAASIASQFDTQDPSCPP